MDLSIKYDETYCITALEMMMGRVKIISTDTGNLKKLLNNKSIIVNSNVDAGLMRETIVHSYVFLKLIEKK